MKLFLADPLVPFISRVFDDIPLSGSADVGLAIFAYPVQLYFDFSGYATMAVGLGLLFGIELPWNFSSPLRAGNPIEFWRRWHITLSRFLRDYAYLPLGGSRLGRFRTSINLVTVMILCGLWHGFTACFLVWGALHGIALALDHRVRESRFKIRPPIARAGFLIFLVLTFAIFRVNRFSDLWLLLSRVRSDFSFHFAQRADLLFALLGWGVALFAPNSQRWSERFYPSRGWKIATAAGFSLCLLHLIFWGEKYEFVYFKF